MIPSNGQIFLRFFPCIIKLIDWYTAFALSMFFKFLLSQVSLSEPELLVFYFRIDFWPKESLKNLFYVHVLDCFIFLISQGKICSFVKNFYAVKKGDLYQSTYCLVSFVKLLLTLGLSICCLLFFFVFWGFFAWQFTCIYLKSNGWVGRK